MVFASKTSMWKATYNYENLLLFLHSCGKSVFVNAVKLICILISHCVVIIKEK